MRARTGVLLVAAVLSQVVGARADPIDDARAALVESRPAAAEEPPKIAVAHEWWYFTVQNPAGGGDCGSWQAMVTYLADAEAVEDHLLFTAVVEGVAYDLTESFPPGTLQRGTTDAGPATSLRLGDSTATGVHPEWTVHATGGGATLDLGLTADAPLWYRRAPEGGGVLEITFAARAIATGSFTIGDRNCEVTGTGYYEHVWGDWSRVPAWGVDYLNVHLDGGWSAYVRDTPQRFASRLDNPANVEPQRLYAPVLILTDGVDAFEARRVGFTMRESAASHPDLQIPTPAGYTITGSDFTAPLGGAPPVAVTIEVADVVLASIFLERTSSGILEGIGAVTATIDDVTSAGTAEVEFQRYGTRYPH